MGVVPGVDDGLADLPEPAGPGDEQQGTVEVWMVLPQIVLLPVSSHLRLLLLCLDELDVQVLGPAVRIVLLVGLQYLMKG